MLGRFLGPENGYDAQVKNICAIIGVRRARSVAPERWPQGSIMDTSEKHLRHNRGA